MEIPRSSSLLATQRGWPNQCLWSEERTDLALSVTSPTLTLLIAVVTAPQQHLEAVWAIKELVHQWRSVLFCGCRKVRRGPWMHSAELTEDFGAAPIRCDWCSHKRCCFLRMWPGFSTTKGVGRGPVTIVFVTTGELIIPQRIRMLSVEKLQQCSNHMKSKVTIQQTKGLYLYFSLGV